MKEENRTGAISRRSFFKRAAVVGAALALPSGIERVWAGESPAVDKPQAD